MNGMFVTSFSCRLDLTRVGEPTLMRCHHHLVILCVNPVPARIFCQLLHLLCYLGMFPFRFIHPFPLWSLFSVLFFTRMRLNPLSSKFLIHTPRSRLYDQLFIKSPNFSARGRASPIRLLQGARRRNLGILRSEQKLCILDFS